MLTKVISGGQTGVDRAGLDAAVEAGIAVGGYCAKGRLAEDGCIPEKYPLEELEWPINNKRTEKNVIASDGTLILNKGELTQGTRLTYEYTIQHGKPCLIVQLDGETAPEPAVVAGWINEQGIRVLNVAGPKESKLPGGIYADALSFLKKVFITTGKESARGEYSSSGAHGI